MESDELAPTLFVAMPFGKKFDPHKRRMIDFDQIYRSAILTATKAVGLDAVRADEDPVGGVVHLPMFERLLLSEIVIADITLASPNVFYELGIRHASRPRSTILISAQSRDIPFDLSPVRVLPYRLKKNGALTDAARNNLAITLERLLRARLADAASDSPLFQLIDNYPGISIPHELTDAFKHRARRLSQLSREIRDAGLITPGDHAKKALALIRQDYAEPILHEASLSVDVLLAYRDCQALDDLIAFAEIMPEQAQQIPAVQEQLAAALNRRNAPGDRDRAVRSLEAILSERGSSPETWGLLGRIRKDQYRELVIFEQRRAREMLRAAVRAYTKGFECDPRDAYPGINAATLNLVLGTKKSMRRLDSLLGAVAMAVGRQGALNSKDYWDIATVFELSLLRRSRKTALRAAARMQTCSRAKWELETTAQNAELISEAWDRAGRPLSWMNEVRAYLVWGGADYGSAV